MKDPRPQSAKGPPLLLKFVCFPLWGHPVTGARRRTGRQGYRILDNTYVQRRDSNAHASTDISCDEYTAVISPVHGVIDRVGADKLGGNSISIIAGGREMVWRLYFAHLSRPVVGLRPGDKVHPGTLLGLAGTTGRSSGPHLHLQVTQRLGRAASRDRKDRVDAGGQLFRHLEAISDGSPIYRLSAKSVIDISLTQGIFQSPGAYSAILQKLVRDRYGLKLTYNYPRGPQGSGE